MTTSTNPQRQTIAVVVDGYSAGNFLPAAYQRAGAELVHVQSTTELYANMKAPNLAVYRENIILDHSRVGEAELTALRSFSPVCVVPGQETGVELADELSERLGLPSNGTALSLARRDKYEMVEALRRAGVPSVQHRKGNDAEELAHWVDSTVGYPAVVKPIKSAGTDGVVICADREELLQAIDELVGSANLFGEPNDEVLAPITPESSSTPTPEILPLNTQFVVAGATMTVTGAEVLQRIATVDGSTLAAEPGQQLVLVHTTYTVSGSAVVDLSCAGGDGTYIKAYDTDGNEMAPIFETSSIPGNPGCNEYLPHGATHTWNFAFTAAAGTKPAGLSITDSNTFDTTILASLR